MSSPTAEPGPVFSPGHDLGVAIARIGWEVRSYVRQTSVMIFTFLFPIALLLLFSVAFSGMGEIGPPGSGLTMADLYLPGMLAAGVILSGVQNLAIDIATEKGEGGLRRLAATPLRPWQYIVGKLGQALLTGTVQAALLIAVAALVLRIPLPEEPGRWLTAGWVYLLSLTVCALLGIAFAGVLKDGRVASAAVIPVLLGLQFVSGIYLPGYLLPGWLSTAVGVLPFRWIGQGFRAAFLPEGLGVMEPGGAFDLGTVALVLGIWAVLGAVLARLTFRWIRRT
ncbi:ABC transporter permease [Brachybacterium hainanense]|uniref:Transport permease protein n=1 Tax=Brachybacterium hainanense TaxID=1541174 RepID=A0ABV6RG20_9MICO